MNNQLNGSDIAIIGMAGRFPDADNLDEFWTNLSTSRESIREFPEPRKTELAEMIGKIPKINFIRAGFLDHVTLFEPELFSLSRDESKFIDPQQRLLLELVEEAILDAGYNPAKIADQNIGVFIAENRINYAKMFSTNSPLASINNVSSANAGRIAYTYNFHEPALTIGTGCSSSLVALQL
ncbi:MAG: polyketide synthase [Halanaerobiales bacterium]|nr:polyketide synthase [Halanaerobiales bacterium]